MLLLGGSSQDRYSWQSHEKWLAPLCTLITVDLPGYGSSDFLPASYDIDFLGDAVQHMLTEVGVPSVNLFGGCFGEVVGLRFAQRIRSRSGASSSVPRRTGCPSSTARPCRG